MSDALLIAVVSTFCNSWSLLPLRSYQYCRGIKSQGRLTLLTCGSSLQVCESCLVTLNSEECLRSQLLHLPSVENEEPTAAAALQISHNYHPSLAQYYHWRAEWVKWGLALHVGLSLCTILFVLIFLSYDDFMSMLCMESMYPLITLVLLTDTLMKA